MALRARFAPQVVGIRGGEQQPTGRSSSACGEGMLAWEAAALLATRERGGGGQPGATALPVLVRRAHAASFRIL
jgi:hypothetical protein